ncbi:hypothetical protein [Kitasatospora cineracea]|uniref:Uncharacterized protein n=1 Tax=Kitasatospora cineracea TaxID=88074 RepID=A0A8G1XC04_9ACTN|nr:hypothetical protein [Kitasatospora cineracea]ROR42681.1 hypothetical protein EDD39_0806 [Kitasatospora cineracea]
MDEQDEYCAAAERAAHRLPTPKPVAVAYPLALLVLLALVTVLIVSGRT